MTSTASRVRSLLAERAGHAVLALAMAAPLFIVLPGYYRVEDPVTAGACQDAQGAPGVPHEGTCVTVCHDIDDAVPGVPVPVEDACITVREQTCPLFVLDDSSAEVCLPIEID